MRKFSVFISAMMAAFLAMPTYAATVTWDPEGATLLSNLIQSVWTQSGNHTVVIPEGNFIGVAYSDWGSQLLFEPGAPGVTGSRAATTLTIQGAGRSSTYLGYGTAGNNNGFLRATNVDFSGVTFKNISLAVGGTQLMTNGPSSLGVTFDNTDVFLGTGSRTGGVTNLLGKMGNGSSGPGKTGAFTFTGNSFIRSAAGTAGGGIGALFRSEIAFNTSYSDGGFAQFEPGSGISRYNSDIGGAYSFNTAAMRNVSNYETSTVTIGSLVTNFSNGGVPAEYQAGGATLQGNNQTLLQDGEYFTQSLGASGAAGWDGGLAISTAVVPEIDPAGMGSVLALVTGGLGLLERRRRK